MAEKRVIELEVKTESVGNLKSELRKAQAEVAALSEKFGATSQEAINAAKKAAALKDAIADAKALTDAYNPDAKFNALSQSIGGVLNGFQAFQGALGLVGVESKDVEEALLKVNSAMALAQGVTGVLESIDSFKTLGKQISNLTIVQKISTAAQWLWNAAMNANPLGAIVIAITAVIAAGYKLISFFQESAAENERMSKSIDRNSAALKRQEQQIQNSASRQKEYNSFQYEYAKASGASAEQLRKLAIKHQEEELALANKNKELAKSTYLRQQDILATMMANDADEELIEKQKEVVKQARENATKAREAAVQENKELVALKRQQLVEIRQEQTDANKKEQEAAKEAAEKRREAAKEANEKRKEDWEKEKDLSEKNNKELLDILENRTKKEEEIIRTSNLTKEELAQQMADHVEKLREDEFKDAQGYLQAEITQNENNFKAKFDLLELQRQKELENKELTEGEIAAIEAKYAQERKKISDDEKEYKRKNIEFTLNSINQGLSVISEFASQTQAEIQRLNEDTIKKNEDANKKIRENENLTDKQKDELVNKNNARANKEIAENNKRAKKSFENQKAVNIASALIATYQSAVSAYQSQFLPIPDPSSPVRGAIAAGLAVAAGLANVKKISSQKFEGAALVGGSSSPSGGGGGSQSSGADAANVITPNFNVVGNAQATNPLAGLGGQPIQAYVVSGEVTTAQSLDRNRVNYATFG